MAWGEKTGHDDGVPDHHKQIVEDGLRKLPIRKTVRRIDTPFSMPGYGKGKFRNMSKKIKIPRQRNAYLREAFFKCYFSEVTDPNKDKKPEEALRIFAKLFYYHQEVRIETRLFFDRYNADFLKESKYSALKEFLQRLVIDGCKTLSSMPIPEYNKDSMRKILSIENFENDEQWESATSSYFKGTDHVDITFNPKKRDFPRPDELFLELTDKDEDEDAITNNNGRRFISLIERDHSINNYISISGKLWVQAFALLVRDALEDLEQEILTTGVLYAYIPQPTIKAAIDHFNQNYPRAKEMNNYEKAYSISLRYKNKISDEPYKRASILKALNRKEKSA
jgi:hypothetical protein